MAKSELWKSAVVALLAFLVVSLVFFSKNQSNNVISFLRDDHAGTSHSPVFTDSFAKLKSKTGKDIRLHQPSVSDNRDQSKRPKMVAPKHGPEHVMSLSPVSACKPARDVVYIKVHKTGSSTLQNIFYRFGDERNLTFMLPVHFVFVGGIRKFELSSVMQPPPGKHYNIMANHAHFFYKDFKRLMPADTKYVTLIREAASHFTSMYTYFAVDRRYKVELDEFSRHPRFYFEKYELNETKRISLNRHSGRDPQLFDLGFDKEDMYDTMKVEDYIQFLDEKMDLVLITEYYFESLILLKELMCWDIKTIVHLNSKVQVSLRKENDTKTSHTKSTKTNALTKRLNAWNAGDFKLYDHFNRTLWRKVDAYGRGRMESEIAELKELCRGYETECMDGISVRNVTRWKGTFGVKEYVLREEKKQNMTCQRLGFSATEFLDHLREKQKPTH